MNPVDILDHRFVAAAYVVTWVLQLGYLAWLGWKWRLERRRQDKPATRLH